MAIAGGSVLALRIERINGKYRIIHKLNMPGDMLAGVAAAKAHLAQGTGVWIAASDRALLAAELKADIRNVAMGV